MLLLPEAIARADTGAGGFIVVMVIYAILTVVGQIKKAANRSKQPPRPLPGPRRPVPDTRSEARRLESLLSNLARAKLAAAAGAESLEMDAEPVDQDTDAEALVQRRIQAAMDRNRALTDADHAEFDQRLKREEAKPPAARKAGARAGMRNAMIWREILGPPKALRENSDFQAEYP